MIKKITCNYIQYHPEGNCGFGISLNDYLNDETWVEYFGEGYEKCFDEETGLYRYNYFDNPDTYDEIDIYVNKEGVVQKIILWYDEEKEKEYLKGYSEYDPDNWNIRHAHALSWGEIESCYE